MTDPIHQMPQGFARLRAVMSRLRDPDGGCPWDIEQTFATIAPYTIEEAYEVADAIARGDLDDLRGELGDLLLQTVYHAQIADEAGAFDMDDVVAAITDKMIARHPHVFGSAPGVEDAAVQSANWEAAKAAERAARGATGVLDDVALALPALTRAEKLQKRLARVGFDWDDADAVIDKVAEEAREIAAARVSGDLAAMTDEVGDLLFAVTNLARHLGVDPEAALRGTNDKVARRFRGVEAALAAKGLAPSGAVRAEMEALWTAEKRLEKRTG